METTQNNPETSAENDLQARYANVYYVHRMVMRNKNTDIRFGQRFQNDCMGATEFEIGWMGEQLRAMHQKCRPFQVPVDGRLVTGLYRPEKFNIDGLEVVLNELYDRKRRTKEYTEFTRDSQKEIRDEAKRGDRYVRQHADAWFDIENGLFWTFHNIDLDGVRKNIAKSVEWMDASSEERAILESKEKATEGEIDPIRARMIAEGRLRPMSHDAVKQALMWSKKRI